MSKVLLDGEANIAAMQVYQRLTQHLGQFLLVFLSHPFTLSFLKHEGEKRPQLVSTGHK